MGKITIEISNDAAARIVTGIRQVIEGLETVAEGVAILSVADSNTGFVEHLRTLIDRYSDTHFQANTPRPLQREEPFLYSSPVNDTGQK